MFDLLRTAVAISRNIGKHCICWFAQKTLLGDFKLADFSTVRRKTHTGSTNGVS